MLLSIYRYYYYLPCHSILFMRLQGRNFADKTQGSCSGEELFSCITLGSPDTLDECLGHRQGGYYPSEVHLQQGHGTRWYVCHCVKPSFLILSSMFTPVPPFPSLILNPIVIYVVLRTTSNPLRNKYIWLAAVHGVVKSQTRLSDFTLTFHFHALEKEMATHSSVLA